MAGATEKIPGQRMITGADGASGPAGERKELSSRARIDEGALRGTFAVFPLPNELGAIGVSERALPVVQIVLPFARIVAAIRIGKGALTVALRAFPIADVLGTVGIGKYATAVVFIVSPFPFILLAARQTMGPFPAALAIAVLTRKLGSIRPGVAANTAVSRFKLLAFTSWQLTALHEQGNRRQENARQGQNCFLSHDCVFNSLGRQRIQSWRAWEARANKFSRVNLAAHRGSQQQSRQLGLHAKEET